MFYSFATKHACDGQTDGRTDGQNYDPQDLVFRVVAFFTAGGSYASAVLGIVILKLVNYCMRK